MNIAERSGLWLFALITALCFWVLYDIIATEIRLWRERRKSANIDGLSRAEPPEPHIKKAEGVPGDPAARGYDSPELFH